MDPERWTNFLPVVEEDPTSGEDPEGPAAAFWVFAGVVAPIGNVMLGGMWLWAGTDRLSSPFPTALVLLALDALALSVIARRAGVPSAEGRRFDVVWQGLVAVVFVTAVLIALVTLVATTDD